MFIANNDLHVFMRQFLFMIIWPSGNDFILSCDYFDFLSDKWNWNRNRQKWILEKGIVFCYRWENCETAKNCTTYLWRHESKKKYHLKNMRFVLFYISFLNFIKSNSNIKKKNLFAKFKLLNFVCKFLQELLQFLCTTFGFCLQKLLDFVCKKTVQFFEAKQSYKKIKLEFKSKLIK